MKVLFTCFPAQAHFFPLVSLAQAFASAGHEVQVATPPGFPSGIATPDFADVIEKAGLTAVSCGAPQPMAVHDRDHPDFAKMLPTRDESDQLSQALHIPDNEFASWHIYYGFGLLCARNYLPPTVRPDLRALVQYACTWQPDLVVWESWFPGGAIAARACGARHVRFPVAPDYNGWADDRFAEAARPNPMAQVVAPLAHEFDVEVDQELLLGERSLDFLPAELSLRRLPDQAEVTLPMRYVPYTGGGRPASGPSAASNGANRFARERPLVVISLGVSVRESIDGDWRIQRLLEAVDGLDADVVATVNERQLRGVTTVPDNVTTHDFVPLDQLLAECDLLIHHGGIGTTMAAISAGVPHLVCDTDEEPSLTARVGPDGIEWQMNCEKQLTASLVADFIRGTGAGSSIDHRTDAPATIRDRIRHLLTDPTYQRAAHRLRQRWLETPAPTDVADELARWARHPRDTTTRSRTA